MIEFDVLRAARRALVLAHDYEDAARRTPPRWRGARPLRRRARTRTCELDVDLKLPGYEREVVEGLRERGLAERR